MALANTRVTMRPVAVPLTARAAPVGSDLDFDPRDIGRLALWIGGKALGLTNGDPIAAWPDRSGRGLHASQSTGSKRPAYREGTLNCKPIGRMDGTDDTITTATSPLGTISAFTLSAVMVPRGTLGILLYQSVSSPSFEANGGNVGFYVDNTGVANQTPGANIPMILTGVASGGAHRLYKNGSPSSAGAYTGTTANASMQIGGLAGSGASQYDFADVIAYRKGLIQSERVRLDRYRGRFYAIPVSA